MKLYVFEGVLTDYTSGMAIIAAEGYDQAIALASEEFGPRVLARDPEGWETPVGVFPLRTDLDVNPQAGVVSYVYGGG